MKVLSLRQPWASLIKYNIKKIETRSWYTKYRGELYIHASKTKVISKHVEHLEHLLNGIEIEYGCIIAKCKLVDCIYMDEAFLELIKNNEIEYLCGEYSIGRYAWILEDIEPLVKPIYGNGKLGIWNYDK